MPHRSPQSQTDIAIKKLWSPNESCRTEGVDELLRIGPASIEKLTSLLADLIHDQRPRFAPGREQEGERALQEYLSSARILFSRGGDDAEFRAAKNRLTALTLNSRLMTDVIHLLGELKAEQAIPLLMEMVNRNWENSDVGLELIPLAVPALERIGSAAVTPLVRNLNEPTIREYGFEPLFQGWRVVIEDQEDEEEEPYPDDELDRQTQIARVRSRVVVVLGHIGDTRALPDLENLLAEIKSSPASRVFGRAGSLSLTIEYAMGRIKKTGPWSVERNAPNSGIRVLPTSAKDSGGSPSSRKP